MSAEFNAKLMPLLDEALAYAKGINSEIKTVSFGSDGKWVISDNSYEYAFGSTIDDVVFKIPNEADRLKYQIATAQKRLAELESK
jgi:hypothetical protein